MDVKAISSVSALNFAGRSRKSEKSEKKNIENEYTQMDSAASKNRDKGLRSLVYGAMLAGTLGTTSCVKEYAWSYADTEADAKAEVVGIGCGCDGKRDTTYIHDSIPIYIHDTDTIWQDRVDTIYSEVIKPVYVEKAPLHLMDSLLAQGININIPFDGPRPNGNNDVVFVASKAYNRFDDKLYETRVDELDTNGDKLSLITKVTDRHDPENPKISWIKTHVIDVPGKGIQLDRYRCNGASLPSKYQQGLWKYSESEIRSNGGRGNKPGVNTVYDSSGNMIWKGEYSNKGQQAAGEFLYGTIARDDVTGEPYYDEDGNIERIKYNFNNAKMWSDKVEFKTIPNSNFMKLD